MYVKRLFKLSFNVCKNKDMRDKECISFDLKV